jgi:nucleoid-associated protein YgaU
MTTRLPSAPAAVARTTATRPNPRPVPRAAIAVAIDAPLLAERPAAPAAARRPGRAVIVRRRAIVAASAIMVAGAALALGFGVGQAGAEIDGPRPAAAVYVVQPGDTLWAIAGRLAPEVDTARAVAELRRAAGTANLTPGQRIALPAGLR